MRDIQENDVISNTFNGRLGVVFISKPADRDTSAHPSCMTQTQRQVCVTTVTSMKICTHSCRDGMRSRKERIRKAVCISTLRLKMVVDIFFFFKQKTAYEITR